MTKSEAVLAQVKLANESKRRAREQQQARDLDAIERVLNGDTQAFNQLVQAHQSKLFAVALGIVHSRAAASDIVQDTFLKAFRKLDSYKHDALFSTWLYRVCVNTCLDQKRRQKREKLSDLELVEQGATIIPIGEGATLDATKSPLAPDALLANNDVQSAIKDGLSALSDSHRTVLILREMEGMSYDEIAQTLDIKRGTVMSRLFHARRKMAEYLTPILPSLGLSDLVTSEED